MKKFAVLAMSMVGFLSAIDSSEAQVLRRFRDNIRDAIAPLGLPQQPRQAFNLAPPQLRPQPRVLDQQQVVRPQVTIQRPAPQRITSGPQQLTPYSRLTPQQRVAVPQQRVAIPQQRVSIPQQRVSIPQQRVAIPQQRVLIPQPQFSTGPRLNAPVPAVQSPGNARVRVVTYLDPRSGQTFQRRYLLPGNANVQGQIATGIPTRRPSIVNQPTATYGPVTGPTVTPSVASIPLATPSSGQLLVPPIEFSQQSASASPDLLPSLTGPILAAPNAIAQPIEASIDSFGNSSQVETVSAEIDSPSIEAPSTSIQTANAAVETVSEGIPDLSGITVDSAPAGPEEEMDQDFFSNDDDLSVTTVDSAPAGSPEETDQDFFSNDADLSVTTVESAPAGPSEETDQDMFFDDDFSVDASEASDAGDAPDYSVLEEIEEE